jgi:hypothetical protein
MERVFPMGYDVGTFCTELKHGALEGLCTCVCEDILHFLKDKVGFCFRRPPLTSELGAPRSWVRSDQKCENLSPCSCLVSSSYFLGWD